MSRIENVTSLFTFGSYEIPLTYIASEGYEIKPNQRQDLDPYTDQTGLTHRNSLNHTKTEVNITLRSNLTWAEFNSVLEGLKTNYNSWNERDAQCTYYDPESGEMKTGHFYLESSQAYKIRTLNYKFDGSTLSFVEY